MRSGLFYLDFTVRDYECDMQGIVNNAVYQNYLEHARHEYLKGAGFEFSELILRGINLVVVRAELDYKRSLRSGDRFQVQVRLERASKLRFAFLQEIFRLPERKLILKAKVVGTVLNADGKPQLLDEMVSLLDDSVLGL
ncbi:MAG TPA: acyl-CoA thioesterase [Geopsychrobacteraceae bacterium]|nr:acyl-CoA thioesterase [Geopsychrobacteraceae bacterium]